jgi:hypothetical protein
MSPVGLSDGAQRVALASRPLQRRTSALEDPRLVGEHDCLDAVAEVELLEDVGVVVSPAATVWIAAISCSGESLNGHVPSPLTGRRVLRRKPPPFAVPAVISPP